MLTSSLIVFLGLGLGWYFYGRKPIDIRRSSRRARRALSRRSFHVLGHAFYVDALYGATLIRLNTWWSNVCDWLDRWVWNGAVQACLSLSLASPGWTISWTPAS